MHANKTENNISSLVCDSCGGTDFRKIGRGEFVCMHCGKHFFTQQNDKAVNDPEKESELIAIFEEAAAEPVPVAFVLAHGLLSPFG